MGFTSYIRRITNFSRQATKVASKSVQGAAAAVKKPTKREDYIETSRLFISKSFLILAAVGLVLLGLVIYFIVWPFILSHFLTARFYQEDKRVPDWTGKVIVYYDEAKKIPMYSGTLREGLLQGPGKAYDEDGLLTYDGDYVNGLRSGNGTAYDGGVVVYEGQFQNDRYEGSGGLYEDGALVYRGAFTSGVPNGMGTAYRDGVKCYEGSFVDGRYQGEGVAYYADGTPCYKGSFSAGLYDGDGVAYYENGSLRYRGAFFEGSYDGEGIAYDETGRMYYRGSFAAGAYDGDGTVYLENGDSIRSRFSAGTGDGAIQWYKNGKLWYDGSAEDLLPDGFGTVYAPNGKVIYAGEMDRGTLDGEWLLSLTAGELREAFGEASVTEPDRESGGGFLITNNDLCLTVLCTFQRDGEDARAYRVWFTPEAGTDAAALLPWTDRRAAENWAVTDRESAPEFTRTRGSAYLPEGDVGGDWYHSLYAYESHNLALVSREEESAPFQIIWAKPGGLDVTVTDMTEEMVAEVQERLDGLLDALESIGASGGSGASESAAPGGGAADRSDMIRLLDLMPAAQDACELIDALTDYFTYGQAAEAMEASRTLIEQTLEDQQRLLQQGQLTQSAVDGAQDRADALSRQAAQYRIMREQARLVAENLTGRKLDGYDLSGVLLVFDPTELDVSGLCGRALAYAGGIAAGRYEVDAGKLEVDVKRLVLDMSMAYENIRAGQKSLAQSRADLETAAQSYATGTIGKSELYDAQCAVNENVSALFQTMGAYTKLVNRLNDLSGGWVAENYDWLAEPFGALYDMALRQAEAEAGEQSAPQAGRDDPGEAEPDAESAQEPEDDQPGPG